MKITIDTNKQTMNVDDNGVNETIDLYSKKAFEVISQQWVKVGWDQKYVYGFSWMGRPIIQLPEDMIRAQEVIYKVKPDVIVETGVAHGGSLIYYASIMKSMGIDGKIIGIDIEIRPHNRTAIEEHDLYPFITLVEGSSIDEQIVDKVRSLISPSQTVMVILDSNHSKDHVAEELKAYSGLVTPGSYIVATDGSMKDLYDVPRGSDDWSWNHPAAAATEFAEQNPDFIIEQPDWPFCENDLTENITHWPSAWLRKK